MAKAEDCVMTNQNIDNALFELCKEVYKRTGWGRMDTASPTDYYDVQGKDLPVAWESFQDSGRLTFMLNKGWALPLYTSDYLLEKLPTELEVGELFIGKWGESYWRAGYFDYEPGWSELRAYDSTPLKALLKLVIALDDTGVTLSIN